MAADAGWTFQPTDLKGADLERLKHNAISLQPLENFVPELIIGGEWNSTIRLVNRGTAVIPSTDLFFVDNLGNPMTVTFQVTTTNSSGEFVKGSTITTSAGFFTLQPGVIAEATFFGTADVQYGFAFIGCNVNGCSVPGLYGEVTLRNRNSTRPDFESVFPLEQPATLQYMLFDHRAGYTSVLYLVSPLAASTVSLEFRDPADHLIRTIQIPMGNGESKILTLHVLAPETIGKTGTLVIRSGNDFAIATALRINPTNSFTPMRTFIPAN